MGSALALTQHAAASLFTPGLHLIYTWFTPPQAMTRQQYETFSALTFAAHSGDVDAVRDLIRRGCDLNAVNYDGRSAFAMVPPSYLHLIYTWFTPDLHLVYR
jgi:ankyrin repeat protein